ncbi:LacI family DNA-binding transcriptional regulator [Pseudomonas oryzihabitans]|uniref:LacI family DNA-binding transcriptional regulator n=1 Tax=Pseudomonas oryzihabitans TaxID=47885 RepID=UPI00111F0320|nr:LacI family DNA-binding transcriptional regulator [Pseudomonas psychrotolerans]QDD88356.1 LacI family transcriptional regulator [Pseudomonas psychrotolerans]
MATIKDVAARAGISYTTVSHVVNNTRPVSPGVREKVEAAIAELGYVPSGVARSLRSQATGTFGVLVPNAVNPYFAELARGIEDHCERQGYSVILCNSDDDAEKQLRYLRVLRERRIDGLVVATVDGDPRFAEALAGLRIPLVLVDRPLEGVQAGHIRIDHQHGGLLATRHLLELGHRRIACIGGPADSPVARERVTGYQQALAEADVAAGPVRHCPFTAAAGHTAARELLAQPDRPTAIFAGNDTIALGVLRAAAEAGLTVPGQLSVVGFDDIELSRYLYPALTTIGQSIRDLGERAAQLLLARREGVGGPSTHDIAVPRLVLRESTAAPSALEISHAP